MWDYISDHAHFVIVTDCLATERCVSLICRGFQFLFYIYIILELKANFTVRRHILLFFCYFVDWIMKKEKGGKRGRKNMDDREKESEVEERVKVTEEVIERREEEEIEERPAIEEAVEQEEERCKEDIECHSSAKRARVCATFTDSQEISIVEFVKQHPELYDKEHSVSPSLHLHPFQPQTPRFSNTLSR